MKFKGRVSFEHHPMQPPIMELQPLDDFMEMSARADRVVIDLVEADFVYPSYLVLLIGVIEDLKKRGQSVEVKFKLNSPVHEYLFFCGFNQFISIPDLENATTLNSEVLTLRSFGKGDIFPDRSSKELVDFIKAKQELSPMVESQLIDSLHEIIRNIVQHSGFTNCYFVGQVYPQSKRVRVVFYDDGVGIKKHLTRLGYEKTHKAFKKEVSDQEYERIKTASADQAILVASRKHVSATNYQDNSGAGLDFIINEICPVTDGKVVIISGDGYVLWEKGVQTLSFPLKFNLAGTLIALTINYEDNTVLAYEDEHDH